MKIPFVKILILFLILIACKNDGDASEHIYQTWEAKTFMSLESVSYPKTESKRILLTFSSTGKISLMLDRNRCESSFVIVKPGEIKMDPFSCTRVCCDSPFSNKLVYMLPQITSYEIEKNTLSLYIPQWGYIQLELAE